MVTMDKSQVERFVDRCFVKSANHITFQKSSNAENYEKIGFVNHSCNKCSWKVEINQSSLGISSYFFSGQISYESINKCEAARVNQQHGLIKAANIYDMDYIRTLPDEEIREYYYSQNGVIIDYENGAANILLCTDNIEKTIEVINNLCDFVRRVKNTRAWECSR